MDNYKIKVNDEAESKEAQGLLFSLEYRWGTQSETKPIHLDKPFLYTNEAFIGFGESLSIFRKAPEKELTLPQLRDLVVLKRNDVKDATHIDRDGSKWTCVDFEKSIGHWWSGNHWRQSEFSSDLDLKLIAQPQDPALISGAEALRALADGKEVVGKAKGYESEWLDAQHWTLTAFLEDTVCFKLKPTTITINTELPKPEREFHQNTEIFSVTYEFKTREERNAFARKLRGATS